MKTFYVTMLAVLALVNVWAGSPKIDRAWDFTRQRLMSGFDGKRCKVQPCVTTDWKGNALLTYQTLLLTGADVFYGQHVCKSTDGGRTWSAPKEMALFKDEYTNGYRIVRYANPRYSAKNRKWYALGKSGMYKGDKEPVNGRVNGKPSGLPLYATVDVDTGAYTSWKTIDFPFPYITAFPFGDPVDLDDGSLLIPFYYTVGHKFGGSAFDVMCQVVCVKYRFEGDGITLVEAGESIDCPELKRGVCEPSLVKFGDRYYLTLRSNEKGLFAESSDGLRFGAPKTWCWEDGEPIGNRNTQQHWLKIAGDLYLAYTRWNGMNQHVFRNRAPVYIAKFDPKRGCLVRGTELAVVPELGARLGNFQTAISETGESWLITAEWMQHPGCERYGSDNSLWFVKFFPSGPQADQSFQ